MINYLTEVDHQYFMEEAIKQAEDAGKRGDLPIGAVIVHNNMIVSSDSNRIFTKESVVSHAEVNAIHSCAPYLRKYNKECVIYTTVEPCIMCLPTIIMANICHVFYGVTDTYMNMRSFIENNPYIKKRLQTYKGGIMEKESETLIRKYSSSMGDLILPKKTK